jgi:glutathione S-transferase
MIVLYQFLTSPFCEKVRRMLNFKGIPFEIHEVPRQQAAEYAWVSPAGKFPAICDNGTAVADSSDIAHYLEARYPQPALLPAEARERALVHMFEDWADESLYFYEMLTRIVWPENNQAFLLTAAATLPGLEPAEVERVIVGRVTQVLREQGLGRKSRAAVLRDMERHFAALAALLDGGRWLVGDCISLADIAVASQVNALADAREARGIMALHPGIIRWLRRVDEIAPS